MNTCTNHVSLASELRARIETRQARIGVIGLGYVGLPLALLYTEANFRVTGFDIDKNKVATLRSNGSYICRIPPTEIQGARSRGLLSDFRLFDPSADGRHHYLCAHSSERISRA